MGKALAHPEWRPLSGALRCGAWSQRRSPPPFSHPGPFGVHNSAAAPRPVLIDYTRSSAEAAWVVPGGRPARFSTATSPSSLGQPQVSAEWGQD